MRLMPLVIVRVLFQVHDPAGTVTVSPGEAAVIAAETSAYEQLAASMVAAEEILGKNKTAKIIPRKIIVLFFGNLVIET